MQLLMCDSLLSMQPVRRLHAELRAAEGELGAAQLRVQEAQEAAEQQRTRAAMAFSAAGAAQRALAEVEELKEQLAAAKQQESRLQALLAHHLGQQRAAEDKCLEAEARLDALSLGLLDGLTAETQHLRGQADQQAAAARTSAAQAAAREAALMAQVSCLQASLAALAEERQVVHEAGAAAAKVHATTALSQLQRLAQAQVFASPVNWERDGTY
ncbi:hypothetical protein HaLaN_03199 [Haematococcus lacustris]|uniref:Uncharacterized protein n=1 Tax=Haematococcus lacustris TaxID=44745 RepID=A0A699YN90_HAELA|nr:hypothetical protein HaLaN_03199 [Haematococcus lacustris]